MALDDDAYGVLIGPYLGVVGWARGSEFGAERRTTHLEAKEIADAIPGITPAGSMLVRIIGLLESHYGDTFEGNNWGCITAGARWTGETFEHKDSVYNEKTGRNDPIISTFRSYATPLEGATDLWQFLNRGYKSVVKAAEAGRWNDVSELLFGYYGGVATKSKAIAHHRDVMQACARDISRATGEPDPFGTLRRSTGLAAGGILSLVGIGLVVGSVRTPRRRRR